MHIQLKNLKPMLMSFLVLAVFWVGFTILLGKYGIYFNFGMVGIGIFMIIIPFTLSCRESLSKFLFGDASPDFNPSYQSVVTENSKDDDKARLIAYRVDEHVEKVPSRKRSLSRFYKPIKKSKRPRRMIWNVVEYAVGEEIYYIPIELQDQPERFKTFHALFYSRKHTRQAIREIFGWNGEDKVVDTRRCNFQNKYPGLFPKLSDEIRIRKVRV